MLLDFLLTAAGFVFVVAGADSLVNSASALAKRLYISELVIGLTVVAFGTSAPELAVNVIASIENDEGIVIGNIMGSNIFNILLILGVGGVLRPMKVYRRTVRLEIAFAVLSVCMIAFAANDQLLDGDKNNYITRTDALQMLSLFLVFLVYNFRIMRDDVEIRLGVKPHGPGMIFLMFGLGMAGLVLGGKMVVDGAVNLARDFGVSEAMIGLTIVSAGTSLPELATSVVAAMKHRSNIAIGNVVGSNIFNSLFILPASAFFRKIPYPAVINVDLVFLIFISILFWLFMEYKKSYTLGFKKASVLLFLYVCYMVFVIQRG